MDLLTVINVAVRSLRRNPVRSSLASLGIVVGIGAIIPMVAIGNGAKMHVERVIAALDPGQLLLGVAPRHSARNFQTRRPLQPKDRLTISDYDAIRTTAKTLSVASVQLLVTSVAVSTPSYHAEAQLVGVDVAGPDLIGRRRVLGSSIAPSDVQQANSVCLLTQSAAARLFPNADAVGQVVRIGTLPFVVIGITSDTNEIAISQDEIAEDVTIMLPYTSILRRIKRNASFAILMRARAPEFVDDLRQEVAALMEIRRGQREVEFEIINARQTAQVYAQGQQTMARLLATISALSLVVGGIGIMNVMLATVSERTREIGIRIALGTRRGDVLRQFLAEAAALTTVGGVVGLGVGCAMAFMLASLNDWPVRITAASILGAIVCSSVVGLTFGYYPARRAAQLDPIETLRFE